MKLENLHEALPKQTSDIFAKKFKPEAKENAKTETNFFKHSTNENREILFRSLKQGMEKGGNKPGSKPGMGPGNGSGGTSEELAKLAAQQAAIRLDCRSEALLTLTEARLSLLAFGDIQHGSVQR